MKSLIVHYRNKYPGGRVHSSESALDVFCAEGRHRVALRRDGNGNMVDVSEELGCEDRHDLAPIPKASRVFKLYADGRIGRDEDAEIQGREAAGKAFADCHVGGKGKVPSCYELELAKNPKADPRSVDRSKAYEVPEAPKNPS